MSDALLTQIKKDLEDAMRAKEVSLIGTIRLLLAAIKQREIDERIMLDDDQIVDIIDKMIRQRNDSIEQYQKGNRQDLADQEAAEIAILKKYMPEALTAEEVASMVKQAMITVGATSIKDMSRVMAEVKIKAQGRADMGKISAMVRSALASTV